MVADKEAEDIEVEAEGILPMGETTKTTGLMMTRGVATTLTMRATPAAMGEIQGITPNQHHVLSRMTPVTW